ncbi:MAG: flavodoxin domain-containing protein [Acidimicrobiia bacterium]
MRVLVATASKHGATAEIGQAIGDVLVNEGLEVRELAPEDVAAVDGFDAVVLGSAVYAGHWMHSAIELAEEFESDLSRRPTWIFSSGPVGDPPKPDEDPVDVGHIRELTRARGHVVFAGKLDKRQLGFGERAIVTAFRAPEGDFRDWEEVRTWATGIAEQLKASVP